MRYGVDTLPHVRCMYIKKLGICWGLVDKISPAFELRNSGVPAVVRSFQLSCMKFRQTSLRLYQIKQVTAYH
jgi:hypothetical protein